MERKEAIARINQIKGQDLRCLAEIYGVTIFRNGKKNKGWAGHVIERHLGIPLNSSRAPNFGSWELKVISLMYRKSGVLKVKETMAITMLDPYEVVNKPFEESHLYTKLKKILIVSRIYENIDETRSIVYDCTEFDLNNSNMLKQVKQDYELVRQVINQSGKLSGSMGVFIQPRTKGAGHGSTSRAFYARTKFLSMILGINRDI